MLYLHIIGIKLFHDYLENSLFVLQLLRRYAGSRLDQSRIIVLSDGKDRFGNIPRFLPRIIRDGIVIDSIIYG